MGDNEGLRVDAKWWVGGGMHMGEANKAHSWYGIPNKHGYGKPNRT